MIGFNGGLIGKTRVYASTGASSGVWTLDEIIPIKRGVVATGGTVTEITDGGVTYKVHTFSSTVLLFKKDPLIILWLAAAAAAANRVAAVAAAAAVDT
jgi:hypothetical protein